MKNLQYLANKIARFFFKDTRWQLFLLPAFFVASLALAQNNFNPESSSYQKALTYLKDNKTIIQKNLGKNNTDIRLLISVVFPEILRYNLLQNYTESTALELLYCNYGKKYADFSVGYFQMKPSFAEKLESYLDENKFIAFQEIYTYTSQDEVDIRRERIKRLNNTDWQLKYLNAVGFIVWFRHRDLVFENKEAELRFLAAAYNFNFLATADEIKEWSTKKAFPHGIHYKGKEKQYNYADIAIDFFSGKSKEIFD